jgi:hypothetical protein
MANVEYDKIYNLTKESIYDNDDVYDKLMHKEFSALETVNRVVKKKYEEDANKGMLYTPVNIVVYRVFDVLKTVAKELYNRKPLKQVFIRERNLYLGVFLIFFSVCFIILYKAG